MTTRLRARPPYVQGRCLDVRGGSLEEGAQIQIYNCTKQQLSAGLDYHLTARRVTPIKDWGFPLFRHQPSAPTVISIRSPATIAR